MSAKSKMELKKRYISRLIGKLEDSLKEDTLSTHMFDSVIKEIYGYLNQFKDLGEDLIAGLDDDAEIDGHIDSQTEFIFDAQSRLSAIKASLSSPNELNSSEAGFSNLELQRGSSPPPSNASQSWQSQLNLQLPRIQLPTFQDNENDPLAFKIFLQQYQNTIELSNLTASQKLVLLKSFLRGRALSHIQSLSITDDNYERAIAILKDSFLNEEKIIETLIRRVIGSEPPDNFAAFQDYVAGLQATITELQNLNCNFLQPNSPGLRLLSLLIIQKLPAIFVGEIIKVSADKNPSLVNIFRHTNEALNFLKISQGKSSFAQVKEEQFSTPRINHRQVSNSDNKTNEPKQQKKAQLNPPAKTYVQENHKICNFCNSQGHSSFNCRRFNTLTSRQQACSTNGRCMLCLSLRHREENCPGKNNKLQFPCSVCKQHSHCSSMCTREGQRPSPMPRVVNCNSNVNYPSQLPVCMITLHHGQRSATIPVLLDSGSQVTYLSKDALQSLQLPPKKKFATKVTTLGSLTTVHGFRTQLKASLPGKEATLDAFICDRFRIPIRNPKIKQAISAMRNDGLEISWSIPEYDTHNDIIAYGLLGADSLCHLRQFALTNTINGSFLQIGDGYIPFGFATKNVSGLAQRQSSTRMVKAPPKRRGKTRHRAPQANERAERHEASHQPENLRETQVFVNRKFAIKSGSNTHLESSRWQKTNQTRVTFAAKNLSRFYGTTEPPTTLSLNTLKLKEADAVTSPPSFKSCLKCSNSATLGFAISATRLGEETPNAQSHSETRATLKVNIIKNAYSSIR